MTTRAFTANQVRKAFIEFYQKRQHQFVASSPVVPQDDPTLLFANAGMNQFKRIFLGDIVPGSDLEKLKAAGSAVNSQKCIRAGGKHNDLDDVGADVYHHTFFEMLGAFSFGSYGKKGAIDLAWEFLTSEEGLNINKERFYVTYFEGSEAQGLAPDFETRDLWARYVPAERIVPGNMKDNFWEMGDVGPCGPATEIHYDRIGGRDAAHIVNGDDPTVVEVWNLVFMQYHRTDDRKLHPLPELYVDTGMGFERLLAVVQDKLSNYDTDLWTPIFEAIQRVTRCPVAYSGGMGTSDIDVAYRIVADHIRSCTLAIADGARPASDGRNYVIRRIARRAIRSGREYLCPEGQVGDFFHLLVPDVIKSLGEAFPELRKGSTEEDVMAILQAEEEAFTRLLPRGQRHLAKAYEESDAAGSKVVSGRVAFVLHDRYGFPLDLTKICAAKAGYTVDEVAFAECLEVQRARAGKKVGEVKFPFGIDEVAALDAKEEVTKTDDGPKFVWEACDAKVLAIFVAREGGSAFVDSLNADDAYDRAAIILDKTSYYAEGGGQIADTGDLRLKDGGVFEVQHVPAPKGGYVLHLGVVSKGSVAVGDVIKCDVDLERRQPIAVNHSLTHMLNWALRETLLRRPTAEGRLMKGAPATVDQQGSLVTEDSLRFDFSWPAALTKAEITAVEAIVDEQIAADLQVRTLEMSVKEGLEITGVRAMFDDKYGSDVRVVFIGVDPAAVAADRSNEKWMDYSIEFCGGTHIRSTKEVQHVAVVEEGSTTAGVRRVRVLAGDAAKVVRIRAAELRAELATVLKETEGSPAAADAALRRLQNRVKTAELPIVAKAELTDSIGDAIRAALKAKKGDAAQQKTVAGTLGAAADATGGFVVADLTELDAAVFGTAAVPREVWAAFAAGVRGADKQTPIFATVTDGAKVSVWASVPAAAGAKYTAPDWIKHAVGRGGGRGEEAQGGTDFANVRLLRVCVCVCITSYLVCIRVACPTVFLPLASLPSLSSHPPQLAATLQRAKELAAQ